MDIQKITSELRATGLTQQALADLVPCSQATINAYENGNRVRRPAFSIVSRLIELHAERCGPSCSIKAPAIVSPLNRASEAV